jgi:hypothetical protein
MTHQQEGAIMTPEEQLELVKKHYALNAAGDYPAAQELLTRRFLHHDTALHAVCRHISG